MWRDVVTMQGSVHRSLVGVRRATGAVSQQSTCAVMEKENQDTGVEMRGKSCIQNYRTAELRTRDEDHVSNDGWFPSSSEFALRFRKHNHVMTAT